MLNLFRAPQIDQTIYANILAAIDHPFIALNTKYQILYYNKAASDLYAEMYSLRLVTGKNLFSLREDSPENNAAFQAMLSKVFSGETYSVEWDFTTSGEKKFYRSLFFPLRNNENGIYGAVLFSEPITRFRETENRLIESEKLYELAVQGNSAAIWDWQKIPGDEQWWSDRFYELLGYQPGEIPSTRTMFNQLLHPEETNAFRNEIWQHLTTRKPFATTIRLRARSGEYRWCECKAQGLWDEAGDAIRLVGSLVDVSDRIHAVKALEESENKFRAIFNESVQLMAILSVSGHLVEVNKTALETFRLNPKTLIGMHFSQTDPFLRSPDVQDKFTALFNEAADGKTIRREITILTPEMIPVYTDLSLKPVRTEGGTIDKIILEARDISEIYRARQAQEKNRLLEIHNQQLQEFAHITSHNLRSPAGNMHVLINLFEHADDIEEKIFIHTKLKESSAQLLGSLDILTETVRIRSGAVERKEAVKFYDILARVKAALTGLIIESGTTIDEDFQVTEIFFPGVYLESIIQNLLSNAIKYRDKTRANLVKIRSFNENKKTILEVTDNGLGIDLDRYGKKIFGLYKTFHGNPDAQGAGLFMVKNQIEAMGGTITVESKPGKGTTFRLVF